MRVFLCFVLACAGIVPHALAAEEKLFNAAPSRVPGTSLEMNRPGFWIGRHPSPVHVVMTPQEIDAFNARIQDELKLTKDIFGVTESFKTDSLMQDFDRTIQDFTDKGFCTIQGVRNDTAFIDSARRNMNLSGVVLGMAPRYGLVTRYADVRFFPTSAGLYESPGDIDFDQLQNSTLDVGSPVAVVHQSLDKKWYYVFSPLSDGWVEADRIALGDMKTVRDFTQSKHFAVTTSPKVDIFLDEGMTRYLGYVRMGTRLPIVGASGAQISVSIPAAGKDNKLELVQGYMDSEGMHEGYLPYTPRVIYTQALAMINQPYGWGGMYGEQDCSAFLDEVFGTVGVILPRDSKDQAQVGQAIVQFDEKSDNAQKLAAFERQPGATAILPMKGHIMLYLGQIDGRPYAAHAVWAFRERRGDKDVPRVLNRVIVSDLYLGEGSTKGSLLKRLSKIVAVENNP